jgi:hypothetical protein
MSRFLALLDSVIVSVRDDSTVGDEINEENEKSASGLDGQHAFVRISRLPRAGWQSQLVPFGVCLDCGGPAPRDGRHWCAACEARSLSP